MEPNGKAIKSAPLRFEEKPRNPTSQGSLSGLSDEFKDALKDPNKINENLHLFEIVVGNEDCVTGPADTLFESQLRALNIKHVYTVIPGTP